MLVTVIPTASIASSVIVDICVSSLVNYGSVVAAYCDVPMVIGIVRPSGRVGVGMIVIPTALFYVTDTVVVVVNVCAGNCSAALVAEKVSVGICVLGAGNVSSALVTCKILILINMYGTSKEGIAFVTRIVDIIVNVAVTVDLFVTLIAGEVLILVGVVFAGNEGVALVTLVVSVFVNVSGATKPCVTKIAFEVSVLILVRRALHNSSALVALVVSVLYAVDVIYTNDSCAAGVTQKVAVCVCVSRTRSETYA